MIATNRYGIFGGTFDPVHNGHIHLVKKLLDSNLFTQLIVVPAGEPWQRPTIASAPHRLEMVRRACEDLEVAISDCEVKRHSPSYAIETVKELKAIYGPASFTWILGSDALIGIESWRSIRELAVEVDFVGITRPGFVVNPDLIPDFVRWKALEIGALAISATEVRRALSEGRDVSAMIPPEVASYIEQNGLYGAA